MSLLVVACLALVFGGVIAWFVRQDRAFWRAEMDERRRANDAWWAAMDARRERDEARRAERAAETQAYIRSVVEAERAERERLLDRIQSPFTASAVQWPTPEAARDDTLLDKVDREWLADQESLVPYDPDLLLADVEEGG